MTGRIWTISNFLSVLRIILLIPIAALLLNYDPSNRWLIVGLMLLAAFTDLFDGMLARKLNQVTEFGKIIDPIADKIVIAVIAIILTVQVKLPGWFLFMIILRDVLILAGGIYIKKRKSITLQSNKIGKWAVLVVALLIIFSVLDIVELLWIKQLLLLVGTVMLVLSFIFYLMRFMNVMRELQK